MLITGGCCHNYTFQSQALTNAVAKHARVEWKIVNEGGNGTRAELPLYDDPNWAKGFDVVVHNECFADTKAPDYMRKITSVHKAGTPAVVIHCAMHTYRSAEIDDWREFLGVTSRRHDHQSNYPVKKVTEHLILKGIPDNWVTAKDELYIIEKLWPNAKALATSRASRTGKNIPWPGSTNMARRASSARPTAIRTTRSATRRSSISSHAACCGLPDVWRSRTQRLPRRGRSQLFFQSGVDLIHHPQTRTEL